MATTLEAKSLFELDEELDSLFAEVEEQAGPRDPIPSALLDRLVQLCDARGEKVDRIGRFVRMMEAREQYCRSEAARLSARARSSAFKAERTKSMVVYYLLSRGLARLEGAQFTLRLQKNSQDAVVVLDDSLLPTSFCHVSAKIDGALWETVLSYLPDALCRALATCIQERHPDSQSIKSAAARDEMVPGTEIRRGSHLRIG